MDSGGFLGDNNTLETEKVGSGLGGFRSEPEEVLVELPTPSARET